MGILDEYGKPFYTYERYTQGKIENAEFVFSNLISAIEVFARSLGSTDVKSITVGSNKIHVIKDNLTNMIFFISCELTAKPKKVNQILDQMRNLFIAKFLGKINESDDKKRELLKEFTQDLKTAIYQKESAIERFLTGQ